ncbi:MAG TPA: WG repeat-containing protein [Terriglobia bacterium]|nr:WG repeat-containing protein [Terriglobia bacterium]
MQEGKRTTVGWLAAAVIALATATPAAAQGLFPIRQNGRFGLMNQSGQVVVPARFDQLMPFSEGLAAARVGKKWGYIDTRGTWVIPPEFELGLMPPFCGSGAFGLFDGKRAILNRDGKLQPVPLPQSLEYVTPCGEGLIGFAEENSGWGFIDGTGTVVIPPQFRGARQFAEGLAAVSDNSRKWGFIDKSARFVIPPQFDSATYFSEGLAPVKVGDLWGYIDKSGQFVIPARLLTASAFSEGLASFAELHNGVYRWGFIDRQGKVVVQPAYAFVGNFHNSRALVVINGKSGYIDPQGRMVIPASWPWAGEFQDGLAAVRNTEDGIEYEMYIDTTGKTVWKSKR